MNSKLITITGPDMTGKETQSSILREILARSTGQPCARFEFPDYAGPIGKLLGAMLDEKPFDIDGYWHSDRDRYGEHVAYPSDRLRLGSWFGAFPKTRNEMVYHALLTADFYAAQPAIREWLGRGHVICDRYADVEDMVYAPLDCREYMRGVLHPSNSDETIDEVVRSWIEGSREFVRASDHVVVFNSAGFDRPGTTPDVNERNAAFQAKVRETYLEQADRWGWIVIDCDAHRVEDLVSSVYNVSRELCLELNNDGLEFSWTAQLVDECVRDVLSWREKHVA